MSVCRLNRSTSSPTPAGRWLPCSASSAPGARASDRPQPGDAVQPAWIIQSAAGRDPRLGAGRRCEFRVGDDAFWLTGTDDGVDVTAGAPTSPEAIVAIEPRVFLRLASGRLNAADAAAKVAVEGDRRVADAVVTMLAGSAA